MSDTTTKLWTEVQIEAGAEAADLLAAELAPLTGGVEIRDAQTIFPTAPDRAAVVALCAPEDVAALLETVEETLATARAGGAAVDPVTIRQRAAHEDEWRDVWKQFFRATRIGRHFIVRPSWDPGSVEAADHVIDLDPGRAFGTGAHPSTKLCIAAIERLYDEGARIGRFLDLGCGSGILAIAASLLWPAAEGLAVDLDPEATACTAENLDRNHVTTVTPEEGSLGEVGGTFELVMANIQADVLDILAPAFVDRLAPGGRLVLSGLLAIDVEAILRRYRALGFVLLERADEGEWASLALHLPADTAAVPAP
jgi:ribosomal protein L11 methyltransferase